MPATALEETLAKHRAFWERKPAKKPLLSVNPDRVLKPVEMELADGSPVKEDMYLTPDLLDPKRMLELEEFPPRPRSEPDKPGAVAGDMLVIRSPLNKMCWVEAVLGCRVHVRATSGSVYSEPYLKGPDELSRIPSIKDNAWLKLLQSYTRALAQNARGRYYVPVTLMRGTIDLVAAVLGYDKMALAIYDQPRQLRKLTERCVESFLAVADAQYAEIPSLQGGRVTPYGVWAPGTFIKSQCDASAAISAKTYEQFFMPYEIDIYKRYQHSNVHLHSGYLHTVDVFLKTEYPTSMQVSLDTGSTPETVHTLMPVFKKVLARKPLFITGPMTRAELDELLTLPATGLMIGAYLTD